MKALTFLPEVKDSGGIFLLRGERECFSCTHYLQQNHLNLQQNLKKKLKPTFNVNILDILATWMKGNGRISYFSNLVLGVRSK